jgi:hypothetical protein
MGVGGGDSSIYIGWFVRACFSVTKPRASTGGSDGHAQTQSQESGVPLRSFRKVEIARDYLDNDDGENHQRNNGDEVEAIVGERNRHVAVEEANDARGSEQANADKASAHKQDLDAEPLLLKARVSSKTNTEGSLRRQARTWSGGRRKRYPGVSRCSKSR